MPLSLKDTLTPPYHRFPTQAPGYPQSVMSSMAAVGAGGFLGYHATTNPVHTGHLPGSAPPHTMAGGAVQRPTPPPQSFSSASTHQPPDFEGRVAAAVASALRNRAAATPAKIPEFKIEGFSGKQNKWVDFHRSVCAAMELPAFSPESEELVTTAASV